ncbi:C2H2-like zinc finger protein [Melia azedarach]|uniref:C2H2-like zinc finger protein n=1 Tax=Melia azedarach TaxID=155640 RepID=A0ACC1YLU4_MELAZ|nr:C2H2-like zinc finger protein [Melia azedarach]
MAMNFNSLSDLGLRDQTIDDLFLPQNTSNFDQSHVNGGGLTGSQLNQLHLSSNTTPGFLQNDLIPQRNQPQIGLGQLGFGQIVTEVRRTYVTPNRVQVQSFVDYSPLQTQLGFPPNEAVDFSEATKMTRFLTPTSTMERLLAPNNSVGIQGLVANDSSGYDQGLIGNNSVRFSGQPNFRKQTLITPNQQNQPFIDEVEPFFHPYHHQNRPLNPRTPRIFYLDDHAKANGDGMVLDSKQINTSINMGKNPVHDRNPRQNSNPDKEQCNINIQNPNFSESIRNQNQNEPYDGRTHSLPFKKYGPYKCPKCSGEFDVSQTFAAHMWSHYKNETSAERKKRLAERYKKINLRLPVQPGDGVAIASESLNEEMKVHTRKRKNRGEGKSEDEVKDEVQEPVKDDPSANAEKSHSNMTKVKEESIAEDSDDDVKKIKKEPM